MYSYGEKCLVALKLGWRCNSNLYGNAHVQVQFLLSTQFDLGCRGLWEGYVKVYGKRALINKTVTNLHYKIIYQVKNLIIYCHIVHMHMCIH